MTDCLGRTAPVDGNGLVVLSPRARVDRDLPLTELLGTLGELNAWIGVINAVVRSNKVQEALSFVQHDLCHLCDQIGLQSGPHLSREHLDRIETSIASLPAGERSPEDGLLPPGGPLPAAFAHLARAICQRAQRQVAGLLRLRDAFGVSGLNGFADDVDRVYLERLDTLLGIASDIEAT